jgi:endonuclease YncB( thermonuclease family)
VPVQAGAAKYGRAVFIADGDTIDVNYAGDGTSTPRRIRFIGVQAMELKYYNQDLSRIRGECWASAATRYLHTLAFKKKVRVTSRTGESVPGRRGPRQFRYVEVWRDGVWQDLGGLLIDAGLVLPEAIQSEYGRNLDYSRRAQQAAAAGAGFWGAPTHCGSGPSQTQPLSVSVNWDADGKDFQNVNGEWIDIANHGTEAVSLRGWWVRDSSNRGYQGHGYEFPASATVQPGGVLRLHVGHGVNSATHLYWGWSGPAFVNPTEAPRYMGDGAFLFDRDGDLRAWDHYPCRIC